jgi:GNAT superfamily N-acetyltransferase
MSDLRLTLDPPKQLRIFMALNVHRRRSGELRAASRIASAAAPSTGPQPFHTFATMLEIVWTYRTSTLVATVDGDTAGTLCWQPKRWRSAGYFCRIVIALAVLAVMAVAVLAVAIIGGVSPLWLLICAVLLAGTGYLALSQLPSAAAARRLGKQAAKVHGPPPVGSWGGGMLAVAPQYRKKLIDGTTVAVALLRELETIARAEGISEMWAPTSSPDAARLYKRLGGKELAGFDWRGKHWSLWRLTVGAPLVVSEQGHLVDVEDAGDSVAQSSDSHG